MPDVTTFTAFAATHPGLQRENNEDRCHADRERGIFFVIDGVGGQAAGDKAAEIAQTLLLARLERETGSIAERIKEAITLANNEIYRASQSDPRWKGMACVLTVAIVRDGRVTAGHVGDTRLYKLRGGVIRKVTRDHSPVGDREDRGELTESEAMRHPRRNEIYRDVGSEPHSPADEDFIDVLELALEPDSALLLCTDGLSDLVSSAQIAEIVSRHAGNPALVVEALLQAANEAGGKDNVSAVFIEGERFAAAASESGAIAKSKSLPTPSVSRGLALAAGCVLGIALVLAALAWTRQAPIYVRDLLPASSWPRTWVVSQDGGADFTSIRAALDRARAGDTIRVEPGEYAEHLVLTGSVTLVSAVPRAAVIVAPADATAPSTAVELQAGGGRISGFRIVGDGERPLAVGIRLRRAGGEIDAIEISGARVAGIEIDGQSQAVIRSSYIHDNPGCGVIIGQLANPRLLHNVIADNGRQPDAAKPGLDVHETARPVLFGNIIANNGIDAIRGLSPAQRDEVARDNIVGRPAPPPAPARGATPGRKK
jgi:serine/threonine protein phosphatase PrpC